MKRCWLLSVAVWLITIASYSQPMPTGWSCETCGARGPVGRALQHKPGYSCSGQSNNYYGGYSPQVQLAQNLLMPVFQAAGQQMAESLMKLFRGRTPEEKAARAAMKNRKQVEKIREQVAGAQKTFEKEVVKKLVNSREEVAQDLRLRMVKSQAVTAIRQVNCAAFQSLQAAKNSLAGLEAMREEADFTATGSAGCPEIDIEIPEVTVKQQVAFQEIFYRTVKEKSDSLQRSVDSLKKVKELNDQALKTNQEKAAELEKNIIARKNEPQPETDTLLAAALRELEEAKRMLEAAKEQEKKIGEDITEKELFIETLEMMRSTYDRQKEEVKK